MTTPSPRYGNAEPTHLIVPVSATDDFDDCRDFVRVGGFEFLDWQVDPCRAMLGRRADGCWSAPTWGMDLSRQNGKTLGVVEPRINYGMGILGERWIYTAHLQKTSTETFEDMAAFWDSCAALRKQVKAIKTALGREEITLRNGARIKFLARTSNGGRGQHGDGLVFDESLQLSAAEQASFIPVISASRNPQTVYITTPPDGDSDSEVIDRVREKALSGGSTRTAWVEWGIDEIPFGATEDELVELAYRTNPSMGHLISEDTVRNEIENMSLDGFARERLGYWRKRVQHTTEAALDPGAWAACSTTADVPDGTVCYAVKFSADGSTGTLAQAVRTDGKPYVLVIESRQMGGGTTWLADWLHAHAKDAAQVVVDGGAWSQALITSLDLPAGCVIAPSASHLAAACSMLLDHVGSGGIAHYAQPSVDDAVASCGKRRIGHTGGFGFLGNGSDMLEAVALALWACLTTTRNPKRKLLVG